MRKSIWIIGFFLFIILFSQDVYAFGLTPSKIEINFQPNLQEIITLTILGSTSTTDYEILFEGDLTQYFNISNKRIENNLSKVDMIISFPEKIEKGGEYRTYITVKEAATEAGEGIGVGSAVVVRGVVVTNVPYSGVYIEMEFIAPDVNIGEPIDFIVVVNNFGGLTVNASAIIDVYADDIKLVTLQTDEKEILSTESKELKAELIPDDRFKPGIYRAIATLNYDEKTLTKEREFRIGELTVNILSFTSKVFEGQINPINIEIESKWNNKIEDVFGEVKISKNGQEIDTLKTSNIDLTPWDKKNLTAFWDTTNLELGKYDAEVTVFYAGETSKKTGSIEIIKREAEIPVSISEPIFEAQPFDFTTILILVILAIIVLIAFFVDGRRRRPPWSRKWR